MKPSPTEKRSRHIFVPLSGDEPARLVCAALILASLAALFRIASIW
jgi:hypothetical protein